MHFSQFIVSEFSSEIVLCFRAQKNIWLVFHFRYKNGPLNAICCRQLVAGESYVVFREFPKFAWWFLLCSEFCTRVPFPEVFAVFCGLSLGFSRIFYICLSFSVYLCPTRHLDFQSPVCDSASMSKIILFGFVRFVCPGWKCSVSSIPGPVLVC